MEINNKSLRASLCRKHKKYFYFLFFFFTIFSYGQTFPDNTPGTGKTFTVPANVTSIKAEVWGSGGSGGGSTANNKSGSGGGGGGYTTKTFDVIAGQTITYTVGAGAAAGALGADGNVGNESKLEHIPSTTNLIGNGGGGGTANSGAGGTGGNATGGETNTSGSNGGAGGSKTVGKGGDGGNAPGTGGLGGNNSNGSAGTIPGGGGGGSEGNSFAGGAGANGQIKLTYISVSDVTPNPVCVGSIITIKGTNFNTLGTTTVSINGTPCTGVNVVNDTTITAVVAAGTTSGTVLVNNPNGTFKGKSVITVNPSPSAIGGGASTVCTGSVTPAFTNAVVGGTWSISNGTGSATITEGGVVTGVTAGTVTVVYTLGTCSVSFPITVVTTPAITSNPSNVSVAAGANTSFTVAANNNPTAYTWQVSTDGGASWNNISNGGVYSNATTATLNITGVTFTMNGYLYRASATNGCGTSAYSSNASLTVQYCIPTFNTSNTGKLYVASFKFIGVLNDDLQVANVSTQSGTNGEYKDFTDLSPKPIAEQIQGSVINIEAVAGGNIRTPAAGRWVAWVDWNKNGYFEATENVYEIKAPYVTDAVTFGFPIPSNQNTGIYRLRIAVIQSATNPTYPTDPCAQNAYYGEMEDYAFKVIEDNNAKLDTNQSNIFSRCGEGSVSLSAVGANSNVVNYKWYDKKYGGTLLHTGQTFTTPSLSVTTPFYVTAIDNIGKETPFRYPFIARIDPLPIVTFSPTPKTICGEDDPSLILSVSGDKREEILFNETFNSGLGIFKNDVKGDTFTDTSNTPAYSPDWVTNPNFYCASGSCPTYNYYQPKNPPHLAIAANVVSGYFGGYFAMINTDVKRNVDVLRYLVTNNSYNTTGFIANSLKLEFDLYYFSIGTTAAQSYIKVQYSDNGGAWTDIPTAIYFTNQGDPLNWSKKTINFDAEKVPPSINLKIRFAVFSKGDNTQTVSYIENIATLDNVKFYGDKPFDRDYEWSGAGTDAGVLYDKTCTTLLGTTLAREVCVKPSGAEYEKPSWTFSARANFQNGCSAEGFTTVYNDTKVWDQSSKTNWNQADDDWKPSGIPTIAKCVIVRTPVELPNGTNGKARSVIVKTGGNLSIRKGASLEVQNHVKNEAAASDFLVESDANLVQNNDASVNSGNITVKRNANLQRLDYNYWGSPVVGQNFISFSPFTKTNRFYTYDDRDDSFVTIPNLSSFFVPAKGYAILSPNNYTSTPQVFEGKFIGTPNNGVVKTPMGYSPHPTTGVYGGRNMISNPYPSNIDLKQLTQNNSSITDGLYYFWTNDARSFQNNVTATYGEYGNYKVNQYAILNALGSTPATASATSSTKLPSNIVKPGQGFIIQAKSAGDLVFNNSLRTIATKDTSNRDAVFFNRMSSNKKDAADQIDGRYWLSLISPVGAKNVLLVGYVSDATNDFDVKYDAPIAMSSSDNFYSIVNDKKLSIQGRNSPNIISDRVPLGMSNFMAGNYKIKLENQDGLFMNNQQKIYIKDNMTGVLKELSGSNDYTFYTDAGEINGRFEIVYQEESTLGVNQVKKQNVLIFRDNDFFVIQSNSIIKQIELYTASGVLLFNKKDIDDKEYKINTNGFTNGTYFIKLITIDGLNTFKIIK